MDQKSIKFCVKIEIISGRPFVMFTVVFDECTMNRTQVKLWYIWFKEGREEVKDDFRPDSPSTSATQENIETEKKMILGNRLFTIREVAGDRRISFPLMPNDFCRCFSHKTCGFEDCLKNC